MYEVKNESRALTIFLSALHTDSTKEQYLYYLNKYLNYVGKSNYDELLTDSVETIQKTLEDYLIELSGEHSRTYINVQFNALFLFFKMNDKNINDWKLRKMFPSQDLKVGGLAYSDNDVKKILEAVEPEKRTSRHFLRNLALVHFFASTGCRLGSIYWLKIKHLEHLENCYAVTVYASTRSEYISFLTPEAKRHLNAYLKARMDLLESKGGKLTNEDQVFEISIPSTARLLNRIVERSGVRLTNDNIRYTVPTIHGFRKRFNTILKSNKEINPNLIELMLGHSSSIKLDEHYLKPTKERLFEEFKKGIADLTIYKKDQISI